MKTVLIAEDDMASFLYLKEILDEFDVTITHAKNGLEAIGLIKDGGTFDLILMDLKMPLINGLEATRQIRQINNTTPIIAQTAYASEKDKKTALHAGCNDYMVKPISYDKFMSVVSKYIG
jgi:CheY-like chemotaxis protein